MKIFLGTKNAGKIKELSCFLEKVDVEIVSVLDYKMKIGEPVEDGNTFFENAEKKAKYYFDIVDIPVVADDSGVFVSALNNEMGVQTRRWGAGEKASDQEWLDFFMKKMETEKNRKASFFCYIVFFDGKNLKSFKGEVNGKIVDKQTTKIEKNIPLSAVFMPDGSDKVFSEMTKIEKNMFSHRGIAMGKFVSWI